LGSLVYLFLMGPIRPLPPLPARPQAV
jgi:hypothetical protein